MLRKAAVAANAAALRARTLAAVMDEALAGLAGAESTRGAPPVGVASQPATNALSPREREVLALVPEGPSNKAIAEALSLSFNTVKTHVASLLHKHDVGSRAQLAAMMVGRTLR